MHRLTQDFWVGLLFILGIILVGIFTIVVQDLAWLQGSQGNLAIVFDRVAGLEKGHKVLASGMEVGQVADLELRKDGKVKVIIHLTKKIALHKDYKIAVKDTSALGGKHVSIEMGTPTAEVIPLNYQEQLQGERTLPPLKGKAQNSLLDDPNLRDIFASLKNVVHDIENGKGTIGLLITQRDIYDNIKAASDNIRKITDQMRNQEGTIGKLLYDRKLYDQLTRIADNVENITADISRGEGTLGKLVKDDSVYKSLQTTLGNANKVMTNLSDITDRVKRGEGTIGKLFADEKVYNELQYALTDARKMMRSIDTVVGKINAGKGTLGRLLQDENMAQDLKETIASIRVVADRLRKGEGTVGKLLADDTLYKEIRRVLGTLSDSLEDTREQVPISTFTSILFRAF